MMRQSPGHWVFQKLHNCTLLHCYIGQERINEPLKSSTSTMYLEDGAESAKDPHFEGRLKFKAYFRKLRQKPSLASRPES